MADPVLSATGLSCGHAGHAVLSGIDLDLAPGTITALIGPNGAGKSTLLKTICASLPPIQGSLSLLGKPLESYSARELARHIAYVPQEEEPQYAFTVREAVIMGRLPHADGLFDSAEDLEAARNAMTQAGCLELEERSVLELSGGELQRVLVARALAQSPTLLLLDEPTSHLDVHHGLDLVRVLRELAGRGLTILVAIHDLNLVSRFADVAVLLGEGGIQAKSSAGDVMKSTALDRIFGVRFKRLDLEEGLVLVPLEA
ncbi:MAG TPA: ABC transporter ATP-binding protein [Fimbriimonadaceae bacterium]|nr:ABC transporter ATP-binding protein [Fimbriimonadaceae bacterium]